ncbi:EAL domain-containing protein [Vibrio harveyi]
MKELLFFFQPKIKKTNHNQYITYGYEALLRTKDYNGQYTLPNNVLELNKDCYNFDIFILNLLKETINKVDVFEDKNISVNVHPIFLEDFNISDIDVLRNFNCKTIELEVIESSMISNFEQFNHNLSRINKETNVTLTLDDFGKGYTSLERIFFLNNIHTLKLDRLMTYDLLANEKKRKFIKWMIVFFKEELNVDIVAEGIQDLSTLKLLEQMGVDKFQGYLFAKPISIDKILPVEKNIINKIFSN